MRIIAPPPVGVTILTVREKLEALGAAPLFVTSILTAVWNAALTHGIHPVGMVAQAAHETKYGKFGRAVDARFFNTCGLKARDLKLVVEKTGNPDQEQPLCHAMFGSWRAGAEAHAVHLWAYCGLAHPNNHVDPRWQWVYPKAWNFTDWEQLGGVGRWAPRDDYGHALVALAGKLT